MTKILIVEDDPMLVEIYDKKLSSSGYETKVVKNGSDVVNEMQVWRPDLVLLDVVLPDMDGYEILEAIKKEENLSEIPIYVFSNLSSKEDVEKAKALGADGFLTKSNYTPSQLTEEIKKIFGEKLHHDQMPQQSPGSSLPAAETMDRKAQNDHRILIIEDEDIFIQMFTDKFVQEGFEVVSAKNGKWGIKEAERGGFSCILLDMMMPAMNGYDAIKELRGNDVTKNIPVIIVSNSALDSEVKKAKELGADAYFIKTQVTPGDIVEEVKKLIKVKL